jgi:hypothetical protein
MSIFLVNFTKKINLKNVKYYLSINILYPLPLSLIQGIYELGKKIHIVIAVIF